MKILVTGINGQVGHELLTTLAPLGTVVGVDRSRFDLAQPESLRQPLREIKPALIVNPAAYTAVDRAEQEPALCHTVNADAVRVIGEEADRLGAAVIHYSTDYVFDGSGTAPRREDEATWPLNVYGASKLAGELALAASCGQYLCLRTSWVYGLRGGNFLLTMLRLSKERPELRVVADQFGAPTWSRFIAERTAELVATQVIRAGTATQLRCAPGILHLTAGGSTNWADFAREIFRLAQRSTQVESIPASAYPVPAKRPGNSRLDCSRLTALLGAPLEPWQDGLARCLREHV